MEREDEAARQARRVKIEELRHLEMCERALAFAYRRHPRIAGVSERELERIALRHFEHAALLRGRLTVLGGRPSTLIDDVWLTGMGLWALAQAERRSLDVYHDHLTDLDEESARLIAGFILPDHLAAIDLLTGEAEERPPGRP